MNWMWVLKFMILQSVFVGVIIFILRQTFLTSTEGAVQRLNRETEGARTKQAELDRKIKEANEELEKRKKEADAMTKKMLEEADEKAKEEREKIVKRAREEGEEIISKAQRTRDQMRKEIAKEVELKTINYAADILSEVISQKTKGVLDQQLVDEFCEKLQEVDMKQIGADVTEAEIVTATELNEQNKNKIVSIIKQKLGREITIKSTADESVVAGVVLKFGSLALDASLKNLMEETATVLKEKAENV